MKKALLFGIKNCDTVKKARRWLEQHQIDYTFIDFKQQPPTLDHAQTWIRHLGADQVLNKRSTTWKTLSTAEKNRAESDALAAVLCVSPTLIKRPLLELNGAYYVGFSEQTYSELFATA